MATTTNPTTAVGSTVSFSKTYTSTISQADATNQATSDPSFATQGQTNANTNGTCAYTYSVTRTESFTKNNC